MISPRIELDGYGKIVCIRGEFTPHGPLKALAIEVMRARVCGYVSNVCYGVVDGYFQLCQSFGEVKAAIDRIRCIELVSLALRRGHVFCEFDAPVIKPLILSIPCDEFKDSARPDETIMKLQTEVKEIPAQTVASASGRY
ncbi:hypothetical protein SPFM8_00168 [Salmonella phage SPFM8]|nr:hypothetical protein SPFM8_00168 [Salmonella phage SPFM8]